MFKTILSVAAILFVVTSMPQNNERYKKRFSEPQSGQAQGVSGICIGRGNCGKHCWFCCDDVEMRRCHLVEVESEAVEKVTFPHPFFTKKPRLGVFS